MPNGLLSLVFEMSCDSEFEAGEGLFLLSRNDRLTGSLRTWTGCSGKVTGLLLLFTKEEAAAATWSQGSAWRALSVVKLVLLRLLRLLKDTIVILFL